MDQLYSEQSVATLIVNVMLCAAGSLETMNTGCIHRSQCDLNGCRRHGFPSTLKEAPT